METHFIDAKWRRAKYAPAWDVLNDKTLKECIKNLTELAEGLNDDCVCQVSEMGSDRIYRSQREQSCA